ncbi:MAG TPA: FkbM family methyltransferase [Xanthobacteraceae bacterium]|jgi:FkbM family methyltransferase|nr:FkbM family methyltransferase [Xanthobacteraceae bacterium]
MLNRLRTLRGVCRSLWIYYGDRKRQTAMDQLYGRFIKSGDLVFDIGSHVGDRVGSFRRLGARVIAVEPQPALATTLKLLYGRDSGVLIEQAAVGRSVGTVELSLNIDNPTISTASTAFIKAATDAPGWQGEEWSTQVRVPMTTLDALIERHGVPTFIKIDVEGFEAEALAGLTNPVNTLSFEFTTIQRDIALSCISRCASLGFTRFNAALGESQRFVHSGWRTAREITFWLAELPQEANSGDIYATIS